MEDQDILCCGANTWVKFFAWFQIVIHSILMIPLLIGLTVVLTAVDSSNNEPGGETFAAVAGVAMLCLLLIGFGLMMGIILLQGAKQRNTRKLRWWLIYAVVSMVLNIVLVAMGSREHPLLLWLRFVILMCTAGFGIWVVWVHISEIELHQRVTAAQPPAYNDQFQYAKDPTPV